MTADILLDRLEALSWLNGLQISCFPLGTLNRAERCAALPALSPHSPDDALILATRAAIQI
jgi:hypothetical protein